MARRKYCPLSSAKYYSESVIGWPFTGRLYLDGWAISTKKELDQACKELIYLNNEERAIKQLGYRTPNKFEQWVSQIEVNLRPQKELYDFATWT